MTSFKALFRKEGGRRGGLHEIKDYGNPQGRTVRKIKNFDGFAKPDGCLCKTILSQLR